MLNTGWVGKKVNCGISNNSSYCWPFQTGSSASEQTSLNPAQFLSLALILKNLKTFCCDTEKCVGGVFLRLQINVLTTFFQGSSHKPSCSGSFQLTTRALDQAWLDAAQFLSLALILKNQKRSFCDNENESLKKGAAYFFSHPPAISKTKIFLINIYTNNNFLSKNYNNYEKKEVSRVSYVGQMQHFLHATF